MPCSKKPRKQMRKSFTREVIHLDSDTMEAILNIFQTTSLAVGFKLHLGTCTTDEMLRMRDMFNLCTATLAVRGEQFSAEFEQAAKVAIIENGFNSWMDVYQRGRDAEHYVCDSKQLGHIRTAFEYIDAIVTDSMTRCPLTFMREWFGVRQIMNKIKTGKFQVTISALKKAIASACIDSVSAKYLMSKYHLKLVPNQKLKPTQE